MTLGEFASNTYKEEYLEVWFVDCVESDPYLGMFNARRIPKEYNNYEVVSVQTSLFYNIEHKMQLFLLVLVKENEEQPVHKPIWKGLVADECINRTEE